MTLGAETLVWTWRHNWSIVCLWLRSRTRPNLHERDTLPIAWSALLFRQTHSYRQWECIHGAGEGVISSHLTQGFSDYRGLACGWSAVGLWLCLCHLTQRLNVGSHVGLSRWHEARSFPPPLLTFCLADNAFLALWCPLDGLLQLHI